VKTNYHQNNYSADISPYISYYNIERNFAKTDVK